MNDLWFNRARTLQGLQTVCTEVYEACAEAQPVVNYVFPTGPVVLAQLAGKLVQTHVVPYVTTLLVGASKGVVLDNDDERTPRYLPTLHAAYRMASRLFDQLQAFNADGLLDHKLLRDACFGEYLHRGAYGDEECGNLQASYMARLTPFLQFKASRKSQAKTRSAFGWVPAVAAAAEVAKAQSVFGVDESLSVELALEMLHDHGQALVRARQLCTPDELPELAARLFKLQLDMLGGMYIEAALDITLEQLAKARDSKTSPPLATVLETVQAASSIVHLMQKHFQDDVLPLLQPSAAAHRDVMLAKNRVLATLEVLINSCLDFLLYGILQAFSRILAKQKKSDYRPKEGTASAGSSPVVHECIAYLQKITGVAKKSLDGKNLEAFTLELARGLHTVWMEHLKKFTYSHAGGLQLAGSVWARGSRDSKGISRS